MRHHVPGCWLVKARPGAVPGYRLFRLVPPSGNEATRAMVRASLQNLLGPVPVSLEIAIDGRQKAYYLRLPLGADREGLLLYLRGAYPQVAWHEVKAKVDPVEDPASLRDEESMAQAELVQDENPGLPLRTEWEERGRQISDPLPGLLHMGDGLSQDERLLYQIAVRASVPRRLRAYQSIVRAKTDPQQREAQTMGLRALAVIHWPLAAGAVLLGILFAMLRHNYGASALSLTLGLGMALGLSKLCRAMPVMSSLPADLLSEKILHPCYDCQVRLTAYSVHRNQESILAGATAAFGQFELGSANRLVARPVHFDPRLPVPQSRGLSWLNSLEIAGLWHFPPGVAEVSGLELTRAPALLPAGGEDFANPSGWYAGKTDHPEARRPVYLPAEVLHEHVGVYGASGMGKSNMLRLLGRWVIEQDCQLVALDPHGTLADYLAGVVPASARGKTVYLVAGEADHPFGINMIEADVEGAASRAESAIYLNQRAIDRSIDTVLATLERARVEAWGMRMRTIAAYGVKLMAEVGRSTGFRYTVLDLELLVTDPNFLGYLLRVYRNVGQDPGVIAFWHDAWTRATESQRREWSLPVINRMNLFKSGVMGNIVGSRLTTVDFDAILQGGQNLIINADTGSQENTRVLMGVILDLVNLAVRRSPKSDRPHLYIMLDEFQLLSIGNLQGLLNELRKWGVRFVLGTQGLGALEDPKLARIILNNIQQIFAFACGPQERETVVELLDGAVDEKAVSWLDSYHCYARLRLAGQVQPVFSFQSAPSANADECARQDLLFSSQALCGRDVSVVIDERRAIGRKYTLARFDRMNGTEDLESVPSKPAGKPPVAKLVPPLANHAQEAKPSRRQRRTGHKEGGKAENALAVPVQGAGDSLETTGQAHTQREAADAE